MDLYFSVIKHRIYPIIPALFLILFPSYVLFQKLFQHNVRMPTGLYEKWST